MAKWDHDNRTVKFGAGSILDGHLLPRSLRALFEGFKLIWQAAMVPKVACQWFVLRLLPIAKAFVVVTMLFTIAPVFGETPSTQPTTTELDKRLESTKTDLEKRIESNKTEFDTRIDQTLNIVMWVFGTGSVLVVAVFGLGFWNEKEARKALEKYKEEVKKNIEISKTEMHKNFLHLLSLQKDQLLLSKKIADLDEPMIRHELTSTQKMLIEHYLDNVKSLKDESPRVSRRLFGLS